MTKIKVSLHDRSCPILVGPGLADKLGETVIEHGITGTAVVITQRAVWTHWSGAIRRSLGSVSLPHKVFLTPGGRVSESTKTTRILLDTVRFLARADQSARGLFIVALGGGTVGDLAGFAASIYRRGIPYIQVPTTLTAQVDSAIGGKTAVDLPQGKNLLGTIYQPRLVVLDPGFLTSLPEKNFCEGLAEVAKYGVIQGDRLLRYLEVNRFKILRRELRCLLKVIEACAKSKALIVSRDERDRKDIRIVLNYGHTFAHAIEAAQSYRGFSHGQAVAIGMMMALRLSQSLGILKDRNLVSRLKSLLSNWRLPVTLPRSVKIAAVMRSMRFDKKRRNGVNRFVLIERAGKTVVSNDVPVGLVRAAVETGRVA